MPPRIILAISAALLLGSGILGFLNKGKLSAAMTANTDAQQKAAAAQTEATKARNDLTKAKKDVADANQSANDAKGQVSGLQSQITKLETDAKTTADSIKAKDDQIASLTAQSSNGIVKPVAAPDDEVQRKLTDLQRQKDELQLVKDSQDNQLKGLQTQLATEHKRVADIADKSAMLGLRGRVLAVNREYNFVVLDLGSRNGVSGNATMIVERGGSLVGRVRTVSVEPSQTVADIVPNSVPAGIIVQPGDTVVFPGNS